MATSLTSTGMTFGIEIECLLVHKDEGYLEDALASVSDALKRVLSAKCHKASCNEKHRDIAKI